MTIETNRVLGRTGVLLSPLTLGTMNFGRWQTEAESTTIIHAALDAGITAIDTADVYGQGESEEIVGKALRGRRDDVFLATKFHGQIGDNPSHAGNSRRWIVRAVEDSLRRLGTDHLDLYQAHRPDPAHGPAGDPADPQRPDPPRQDPLLRDLGVPRPAARRGALAGREARSDRAAHRAAAVLAAGPRRRA